MGSFTELTLAFTFAPETPPEVIGREPFRFEGQFEE